MTKHRRDIDGLRAVAVTLVVAFHAGIPFFDAGFVGVDVFFVLSGFLITGILAREADDLGTVRLGRFYTRRLRRLLPASTLTVVVTLIASALLVSALSWKTLSRTAIAAAAYASNLYFGQEAGNYFADSSESNPLLHFWSLAVEEQFYIVWPLIIAGVARFGRRARTATLTFITVASFVHSVMLANAATPWAYYSPFSRAWEFGAGGLLALALPAGLALKNSAVREALAWGGLLMIGSSLIFIGPTTPFPGIAAVPTVLGTCLVIAAAVEEKGSLLGWILGSWPFQQLGALSYSWYLWHWPVLVIGMVALGTTAPAVRIGLVLLSLPIAAGSYYLLERPVRFAKPLVAAHRPNWAMAGVLIAVMVGGALLLNRAADAELNDPEFAALVEARDDVPFHLAFGCNLGDVEFLSDTCSGGSSASERTILVLGDSHAEMWTPMLEELSDELDFRYVIHILGGCNVVGVQPTIAVDACRRVQSQNLDIIDELQPDAIFVSHFAANAENTDADEWRSGLEEFLAGAAERNVPVGWVHDAPTIPLDPVECAAKRNTEACTPTTAEATRLAVELREREADILDRPGVLTINPVEFMCNDTCPLISNGTFHYRDNHHITASYAMQLGPDFEAFLADLLDGETATEAASS